MSASPPLSSKNGDDDTSVYIIAITGNGSSGSAVIPTRNEHCPPNVETDEESDGDEFDEEFDTADDDTEEEDAEESTGDNEPDAARTESQVFESNNSPKKNSPVSKASNLVWWNGPAAVAGNNKSQSWGPGIKTSVTYAHLSVWETHRDAYHASHLLGPRNPAAPQAPSELRRCTTFHDLTAEKKVRWASTIGDSGNHNPWATDEFDLYVAAYHTWKQVRFPGGVC
jgi:hypothetical protein